MGIIVILCLLVSDAAEAMMVQHLTLERAGEQSTRVLLRRRLLWKRLFLASVMLPVSSVSGFFPFQMTKRKQATAGASQVANVRFVEDGFRPLALQKLSRGTGAGRVWREGTTVGQCGQGL